jgi:hypothetical protein
MKPALLAIALFAVPVAAAQPPETREQVTIEHYYRIKWGSDQDFKRLYRANHEPILREMQKAGYILSMKTDVPFTHMAGGQRWDMRVTISYRDAAAAVLVGGAFDEAFEAAKARLYPDAKKLDADEARRFALLEEHWDVIVVPSGQ